MSRVCLKEVENFCSSYDRVYNLIGQNHYLLRSVRKMVIQAAHLYFCLLPDSSFQILILKRLKCCREVLYFNTLFFRKRYRECFSVNRITSFESTMISLRQLNFQFDQIPVPQYVVYD